MHSDDNPGYSTIDHTAITGEHAGLRAQRGHHTSYTAMPIQEDSRPSTGLRSLASEQACKIDNHTSTVLRCRCDFYTGSRPSTIAADHGESKQACIERPPHEHQTALRCQSESARGSDLNCTRRGGPPLCSGPRLGAAHADAGPVPQHKNTAGSMHTDMGRCRHSKTSKLWGTMHADMGQGTLTKCRHGACHTTK